MNIEYKNIKLGCSNYFDCIYDVIQGYNLYYEKLNSSKQINQNYYHFLADLNKYVTVSFSEIIFVIFLGIFLTLFRYLLTDFVFKPISHYLCLTSLNASKLPESAWKCLYYITICSYLFYLLVYPGAYDYFFNPQIVYNDWFYIKHVPVDISLAYALEFSFYLHSCYGTLYMDHWRKDSIIMLLHHILCLLLISFAYSVRYHKSGVLLMFVHDYADIFLESSKIHVYLKNRGGKYYVWHNHAATVGFLAFTIVWFVGRLYLYPMIVMRPAAYSTLFVIPDLPFYVPFNVMLFLMLTLNVYWFIYILNFLYRVASGQMKDIDDIREYDMVQNNLNALDNDLSDNDGGLLKRIESPKSGTQLLNKNDLCKNGVFVRWEGGNGVNHSLRNRK